MIGDGCDMMGKSLYCLYNWNKLVQEGGSRMNKSGFHKTTVPVNCTRQAVLRPALRSGFLYLIFILMLAFVLLPMRTHAAANLSASSLTLSAGNAYVLRLSGVETGSAVTWKSSRKKVVTISSSAANRAVLKANRAGKSKVTAEADGKTLTCTVTVKKRERFPARLTLTPGDTFTFKAGKKASWSLTRKRGTLQKLSGDRKAVFTAVKTGNVTVKAETNDTIFSCKIKIIRSDGATKAELKEEQAQQVSQSLTVNQESVMTALAFSAVSRALDTGSVYECEVHAMDLTDSIQAFMLYHYQYIASDSRIKSEGEYNTASAESMQAIMNEMFGGATGSGAWQVFRNMYVEKAVGSKLYMSGTGDFGDTGPSYFEGPDSITWKDNQVTLEGRVMVYNEYAKSYIHRYTYRAVYWKKSSSGALQFDHVTIA